MKYIDLTGLTYFKTKLDSTYVPQTRTVNGHALSSNVTVTKSDIGLSNVDNVKQLPSTTKYAASASVGGAASSVANSLTIKLNSGTKEGTNLFTYNGSGAKSVNITPSAIGAAASSHTHSYAGSSSAGGAATSANKLNTNAGSATQPVYFSNGVPVKTTYTLGASVPSNAKFTDTTYSAATTSAAGLMSAADKKNLDALAAGRNITYSWDSSTRVITFTNLPTNNEVYYRKSSGVLGTLTVSNSAVTVPTDSADVIEIIVLDKDSSNKSIVIL